MASCAFRRQRCDIVALFTCVRAISFSMSRIFSTVVMVAGAIPWEWAGSVGKSAAARRRDHAARGRSTAPHATALMVSLSALLVPVLAGQTVGFAQLWHARLAGSGGPGLACCGAPAGARLR